jgi:hypothetical protein
MKQNETKKVPKSSEIFVCKCCDYNTSRRGQYDRHMATDKHQNMSNETNMKQKSSEKFHCECGISFKSRTTLWRHKKVCDDEFEIEKKDDSADKDLIMMLVKQNSELLEVLKNGTHNTNSNNTITNNKTFNLQFFLNETCKDAMNIMDFVDSIKLQLSDLENVGKLGYVEGISNIITSNLKALDVTQRPIHCADKKREVLYIKDDDKWEKEDEEKKKIKKVINRVVSKNQRLLPQFKEAHPDCMTAASRYSDQYNKLIIEAMGGRGDNDTEKEAKIIKNITTVTTIDKDADI